MLLRPRAVPVAPPAVPAVPVVAAAENDAPPAGGGAENGGQIRSTKKGGGMKALLRMAMDSQKTNKALLETNKNMCAFIDKQTQVMSALATQVQPQTPKEESAKAKPEPMPTTFQDTDFICGVLVAVLAGQMTKQPLTSIDDLGESSKRTSFFRNAWWWLPLMIYEGVTDSLVLEDGPDGKRKVTAKNPLLENFVIRGPFLKHFTATLEGFYSMIVAAELTPVINKLCDVMCDVHRLMYASYMGTLIQPLTNCVKVATALFRELDTKRMRHLGMSDPAIAAFYSEAPGELALNLGAHDSERRGLQAAITFHQRTLYKAQQPGPQVKGKQAKKEKPFAVKRQDRPVRCHDCAASFPFHAIKAHNQVCPKRKVQN